MDTIVNAVENALGINQEAPETIVVDAIPEANTTREEMVAQMGEEAVAKIESEATPVNLVEAPVEAETAPETVVEPVVEETVEATPEVAVEAEAVDLGWQKGVHYF